MCRNVSNLFIDQLWGRSCKVLNRFECFHDSAFRPQHAWSETSLWNVLEHLCFDARPRGRTTVEIALSLCVRVKSCWHFDSLARRWLAELLARGGEGGRVLFARSGELALLLLLSVFCLTWRTNDSSRVFILLMRRCAFTEPLCCHNHLLIIFHAR